MFAECRRPWHHHRMTYITSIAFPIGTLFIHGDENAITRITWEESAMISIDPLPVPMRACLAWLEAYARGGMTDSAALILSSSIGTAFQRDVWRAAQTIPPGEVRTYGELAMMIGRPNAARAVGNALNQNPFAIVVPCHRIVASNGPGGFAWGESHKRWLLSHENIQLHRLSYRNIRSSSLVNSSTGLSQ